jgi:hypothetical protein
MAVSLPFNLPKGSILSAPMQGDPTQEDSLALYNNSKKVQDYYNSKKYKKREDSYINTKEINSKVFFNDLDKAFNNFKRINSNTKSGVVVPIGNNAKSVKIPESSYRRIVDENKFLQREKAAYILDTRAPMQLYDKRIAPTKISRFNNESDDVMQGDIVDIDTYDPILVKPVNMLTPEEKEIRLKRYGKNSGIKSLEAAKAQQLIPAAEELYNYDDGDYIMAPTPGGGGGAMVGVKKKDGTIEYVKPEDYKRMGVPDYGKEYIRNAIGAQLLNILGKKGIR